MLTRLVTVGILSTLTTVIILSTVSIVDEDLAEPTLKDALGKRRPPAGRGSCRGQVGTAGVAVGLGARAGAGSLPGQSAPGRSLTKVPRPCMVTIRPRLRRISMDLRIVL